MAKANTLLGKITKDTQLSLSELEEKQDFTQPPAHYTEASLVKTLEELGNRKTQYLCPTITTLLNRRYVTKESKNLYMIELGEVVNNIMKRSVSKHCGCEFYGNMESPLDMVEEGKVN